MICRLISLNTLKWYVQYQQNKLEYIKLVYIWGFLSLPPPCDPPPPINPMAETISCPLTSVLQNPRFLAEHRVFRVKTVPASLHCSLVWPNANTGEWGLTSRISPKWAACALLFGFFQAADWKWSIPVDTWWPWGRKPRRAGQGEEAPGSQLPYGILLAPHHWPLDLAGRGTSCLI